MDAILILIISVIFLIIGQKPDVIASSESSINYEVMDRETKLNEDFYDDADAFRRIIHELGF